MHLPLEGTHLSVNIIIQLSSLPLSSSSNNWLYSWCASNNILKTTLNCFIPSSTAIMFLLENSKSSMVLYFLINLLLIFLLLSLSESLFLVCQTLLSEGSRSCCSTSITMSNDAFPCTLFNPLWVRTVIRHTQCLSDLGPSFIMLNLINHPWLTSCNPIWIPFVSIMLPKIYIQSFSKWHSSRKVNQILQLYILILCYCTIGIWVNMLYLMDHLINLSVIINNR